MDPKEYIKPELLILVPVLTVIGKFISDSLKTDNKHIPVILGVCGIVLSMLWVVGNMEIFTFQHILIAVFTALVQGLICAGLAVYGNQIFKQYTKA